MVGIVGISWQCNKPISRIRRNTKIFNTRMFAKVAEALCTNSGNLLPPLFNSLLKWKSRNERLHGGHH